MACSGRCPPERNTGDSAPDRHHCASASFEVDGLTHVLASLARKRRGMLVKLGDVESRFFRDRLRRIPLSRPVFIAGLARAGSTLLLEYCASHETAATHCYRDFPFVLTPLWWNRFLDSVPRRTRPPVERAHRDGLMMTPESPEAMEEMVWSAFFPHAHDCSVPHVLDRGTTHDAFPGFYRDHIRKVLYLRKGRRYVCKNNYNVVRLRYLLELFPDCRFIIPVRDPAAHVGSLIKQHRLFVDAQKRYPRAREYLRCAAHFEFGLDRRPIHTGDDQAVKSIVRLWERGEEIRGWARYWTLVHEYIADTLDRNPDLKSASLVVPFEELCAHPLETLRKVSSHCRLPIDAEQQRCFANRVRYPDYYDPGFSDQQRKVIADEVRGRGNSYDIWSRQMKNRRAD